MFGDSFLMAARRHVTVRQADRVRRRSGSARISNEFCRQTLWRDFATA
ncbi:hypothetical protein SBRY_20643 [Actinacidiphila bryophytorum]|uniref:Uncharacterized protein n=1 Tax=Actinacidiphila bryophytorum TaxID=1436133 RepID=A0A9W4GYD0_9ACTN|nr:hypothetical protein SBRY_20643 [Actinacidiphila bryophytorum]